MWNRTTTPSSRNTAPKTASLIFMRNPSTVGRAVVLAARGSRAPGPGDREHAGKCAAARTSRAAARRRNQRYLASPAAFIVMPIAASPFAMNAANSAPGAHAVP